MQEHGVGKVDGADNAGTSIPQPENRSILIQAKQSFPKKLSDCPHLTSSCWGPLVERFDLFGRIGISQSKAYLHSSSLAQFVFNSSFIYKLEILCLRSYVFDILNSAQVNVRSQLMLVY